MNLTLDALTLAIVMQASRTQRGTPCVICGTPINSKSLLRCRPGTTTCSNHCFITLALSEPLIASNGVLLHEGHPAAIAERAFLAAKIAA
jgi:hypothetical protein